ncbi:hypothetical protein A2473_02185 [candidate division WWE3 bacterium RIFOXYC2_FULL_42_13]|uniref:Thioredoxin-like fold domain-containing protein n=2 Tax=Katanobacteria TaxID=422282 RepID=A0A0G1EPI4_UNCKA|nr:MAG: hypothetical protein UV89_C0011G0015 [candidate division WWE3 bacterium GW2011_GWB2_43_22]OGC58785.1 MAG: hypothetical protein A2245_03355 [candidate division WWE3 bacterium RIFOXYA2_FULL_43_12]OGC66609.1 MAG: hypothetical protein A2274_03890 [candidate division WWE3 bacterium RIFOXYA12_FULL_43_11]OGC71716.1 MAG: hypothetical protein A2337_03270 [candidate division WWE3 bacterium RIFOXYB2_FULL_43_9]OGC73081.1 MAG: hypothetical protein A2473_02185 [candidate division WWE3 bacterium RIFOX
MNWKSVVSGIGYRVESKKEDSNIPWTKIILVVSVLATVIGALAATKTLVTVNKNIAAAEEEARPANVSVIKIVTPDCQDCFSVDLAVDAFKRQNVKVEEEKTLVFGSPEADASVKQLSIKRIPTYIVSGEVNKSNLEGFVKNNGEITNDTFVFTKVTPVFIDTESKQEIGKVIATILTDPSCTQCVDPKLTLEGFKKSGVKIIDEREVVWNSFDGRKIIDQFKITKLPTFILSPEIDFYDNVKAGWSNIGTIEQDRTYVARNLFFPYRDLEENRILGLVDLVYLIDSSCGDCYKVNVVQKPILEQGYGVRLRSERTVDVLSAEGQSLTNRYEITKLPTILMSPDVDVYTNLQNVWKSVGTIEQDGWYIFREMQQLGGAVYKDLTTGQTVGNIPPSSGPGESQ